MAGRDQVEEVKQKTDIVSVISEHLDLKKAGRNYKANCPFHGEKTPSFMVSPELQIFKCFGCGESGDVFTFLEKHEGMEFYESLQTLSKRAGVKLKAVRTRARSERQKIYEINQYASKYYQYVLRKHKLGQPALSYLLNTRKLNLETIKKFGLGFSPVSFTALGDYLIKKKGFTSADLELAGLTVFSRGRAFDRFRGRLIFSLYDHRGNVAGFTGRILPTEQKTDLAKYINSPETLVYHKSSFIYGLNFAKRAIKLKNYAIVVEGNVDVISLWQAGYKNVVAITGSAFTEDQARLLNRYTDRVIIAFDPDMAGNAAAIRGINQAQKQGFEIKVAKVAGFADPDEMVRKDPKAFKKTIKQAVDVWDFIIDGIFEGRDLKQGNEKQRVSSEVVPILGLIPDRIVQAHYVKKVAQRLDVPVDAVTQQVVKIVIDREPPTAKMAKIARSKKVSRRDLLEQRLLVLVFQSDPQILLKKKTSDLVKTIIGKRILEEYKKYAKSNKEFDSKGFLNSLPIELKQQFSDLILDDTRGLTEEPDLLKRELDMVLRELETVSIRQKMTLVAEKIRQLEKEDDKTKIKKNEERFAKLAEKLSSFKED